MSPEINYKKRKKKKKLENSNTNKWRLKICYQSQCITEEIKEQIKRYLETTENENKTNKNLRNIAETLLIRKFIVTHLPQETKYLT